MGTDAKTSSGEDGDKVPGWQRLLDSPFLLLIAGMIIMVLSYTGWGLIEILMLPQGTLP